MCLKIPTQYKQEQYFYGGPLKFCVNLALLT